MAKKNPSIKIVSESEKPASVVYGIEQETFQNIVRETLKAQEASLNAMKLIAGSIFGENI